jgi:hypothetical protein
MLHRNYVALSLLPLIDWKHLRALLLQFLPLEHSPESAGRRYSVRVLSLGGPEDAWSDHSCGFD